MISDFADLLGVLGCADVSTLDDLLRERTGESDVRVLPPTRVDVERISVFVGSTLGQVDFPSSAVAFWDIVEATVKRAQSVRKWDAYESATIALVDDDGEEWWWCDPTGRRSLLPDPVVPEFVLTAHNPSGVVASPEDNHLANERLAGELRAKGVGFVQAIGGDLTAEGWAHREESFAFDTDRDLAVALAASFGQDALFRIRANSVEVIDAATGKIARVRYDPPSDASDDDENWDSDDDGCDACAGLEELMVENAAAGVEPHESMGYIFGYADACEMCGRSIDTDPAFEAHEQHLRDLENDDLQTAMNDDTSSATLDELAASADADVRRAVASNPAAGPETLARLCDTDADRGIRQAVARNPSASAATLRSLHDLREAWVVEALAANPSTPTDLLGAMAQSGDALGLLPVLAAHPNMPAAEALALIEDGGPEVAKAVAASAHATPEVLRQLARHPDTDVRWTVAHAGGAVPEDAIASLAHDAETLVRIGVGYRKGLSDAIATTLSRDVDAGVRLKAAGLASLPHEDLERLAGDDDSQVRDRIARRPDTPVEILRQLATDAVQAVRVGVTTNPSVPLEVLVALGRDADARVRQCVAYRDQAPDSLLIEIAERPLPEPRTQADADARNAAVDALRSRGVEPAVSKTYERPRT